jgi:peptidoglycan hydrolase CwlO-like protein
MKLRDTVTFILLGLLIIFLFTACAPKPGENNTTIVTDTQAISELIAKNQQLLEYNEDLKSRIEYVNAVRADLINQNAQLKAQLNGLVSEYASLQAEIDTSTCEGHTDHGKHLGQVKND